ncbi:hypothetical protein [Nocardia seriolae]|uniref:Glycine zipper 2TM domain-containing protein n=1 Tax=Nocardia seriolae TaxID=37332 RepID=A0ABC9Z2I1_9NOCA|nr:hypothetical protein [Nocardia seriolae]APA96859.1 hypothetical protein NS506_02799 [Nocardia seriolae]QOW33904.1 hypothetical protein IMZ23_01715 [Nocardia seriolae]QUN18602.1 hypothetical protein KEC46_04020 [Nocardia seriolae]WNJ61106.1 hypothetical protein RMO66_10630 [Nocardia seriolae]BEK97766.1 hypothetical protein NSER024013_56720 [Nocardia seriolae]
MIAKRLVAATVLAVAATVGTAGLAYADPLDLEPAPAATAPVDDPDVVMHQCNAIIGALVGGLIGGTLSALPGAAIGAGIGALVGWSQLTPPGPPLACWNPPPPA